MPKRASKQFQLVITDHNRRLVSGAHSVPGANRADARRNARTYLKRLRARIGAELDKAAERSR